MMYEGMMHYACYLQCVHVSDCSSRHDDIVDSLLKGPWRKRGGQFVKNQLGIEMKATTYKCLRENSESFRGVIGRNVVDPCNGMIKQFSAPFTKMKFHEELSKNTLQPRLPCLRDCRYYRNTSWRSHKLCITWKHKQKTGKFSLICTESTQLYRIWKL